MVFRPNAQIDNVVENAKDTQLLGWFKANQDPDLIAAGAHDYLYQDFPKKFVWQKGPAVWKVRQRYKAIGRMYTIPVSAGEAFYLHLLLTVVKGIYCFLFQVQQTCAYISFSQVLHLMRIYAL